ncbi:hypothetical protein D3C73_1116580 [compost metagenome]
MIVPQHRAFDLTTNDPLFHHHFMVELKCQRHGLVILSFVGDFADPNGRALISRLDEQRQAQARFNLCEADAITISAGERNKGGNV